MYKLALAAFSLIPAVLGQAYGGAPAPAPSSSSSSSSAAAVPTGATDAAGQILVQVGQNGFTYSPSNVNAPVGTLVTFVFSSNTPHSVTEASFADPCTPLQGGFDSGVTTGTTFSVNVTDASTPIYFSCKFPGHCGLGMAGTINAPASGNGSTTDFINAAKAIGSSESNVPDNGPQTGGVGAVATAGPTSGTPSVAAPSSTSSGSSSSSSSSTSPSPTSGSNGAAPLSGSTALGLVSVVAGLFAFAF
ncbi:cupredoxin domain-containing protein [Phanerochaete sordida]|uniref:Cupredoxin domain-containing protein n=1 Tax=Phanerochaete sordida TaxID=48140 RepID=A0A9P3LAC3_9APHY|nr:cupredoxin domain-containing protein [Phanerochaete sordida]